MIPPAIRSILAACLLGASLMCAGCGYTLSNDPNTATSDYHNPTLYRKDVKTVAVPIFTNKTYYRGVEFGLTKAIINQLETHSPYKVVSRDEADTLLEGEIISVHVQTSSNNVNTGLPQEQLYIIGVDFRWKDLRSGKMLVDRHDFEQTAPYYPTLGESQFYGTQENIEKLSLAIVQEMQDNWGTEHEDVPPTTQDVP
jgi:Lipopolysaccharide-assembly